MPPWLPYVLAAIVAVPIIALMLLSTFSKNLTAVTAGDLKVTVPMYNYFFIRAIDMSSSTIGSIIPDSVLAYGSADTIEETVSALKKEYFDEDTGKTMYEYVIDLTNAFISDRARLYNAAMKDGFELTFDDKLEIDDVISSIVFTEGRNFEEYLDDKYGDDMTEEIYRYCAEIEQVYALYPAYKKDTFIYSPEEIEAFYEENSVTLDTYTYRYIHFPVTRGSEESLFEEARAQAVEIISRCGSEEDFIAEAKKYNSETYAEEDSTLRSYMGSWIVDVYGDWIRDSSRKYGDMESFTMTGGAYAVFYISRNEDKSAAEDKLQDKAYNAWRDSEPEPAIKSHIGMYYIG